MHDRDDDPPKLRLWDIHKIERGPLYLPDPVTSRWLQFTGSTGEVLPGDGEVAHAFVMTLDSNENPRKLCEIFLGLDDLQAAIDELRRLRKKRPEN